MCGGLSRSSPAEAVLDCCFTCKTNYMPSSSSVANGEIFSCIPACRPGQTLNTVGRSLCVACPVGKFSVGGQAPCEKCHDLGHTNARADPLRGCISCGNRQAVDAVGVKCIPCISGQQVLRESKCVECPLDQAYYIPESGTACVLCHRGTYKTTGMQTCAQCAQDTYNPEQGSTACVICPSGTRSVPNRTVCAPCAAINRTLLPYSEYYEPGCRVRCKPLVSYLITNPYSIGGCGRCQDIVLPKGTRSDSVDCSIPVPCVNTPLLLSSHNDNNNGVFFYNGSAAYGSVECPWDCNAGFYRVNGECRACVVSNFDSARHVFTSHCEYACKPYVYADSSKACDKPCVDLIQEYDVKGLIHGRVREYGASIISRPNYVLGVCGSSESIPRSDIPFLRLGRWAYVSSSPSAESACGNSLLNVGEECDDGNDRGGDGCSSTCQVETFKKYWDCDLIGSPCMENCGWTIIAGYNDDWGLSLEGYIMPPCPNDICSCVGLYYYDVERLPAGQRTVWMNNHLFSCGCDGNFLRAGPYANCTLENKGCRMCGAHEYHDDLLGKCVACGTACPAGYTYSASEQLCQHSVSTSLIIDSPDFPRYIGCVPCAVPSGLTSEQVRFIQDEPSSSSSSPTVKCRKMCYRDTTGETYEKNTFCSGNISKIDWTCPGSCLSCENSYQDRLIQFRADNSKYVGFYPKGCSDVHGFVWAPCDPTSKPSGAHFTTTSTDRGAKDGCAWECDANHILSRGLCIPCFDISQSTNQKRCKSGEKITRQCNGDYNWGACEPCDGPLPFPLQVWVSTDIDNYETCRGECELGISWGPEPGGPCTQCFYSIQCDLGEQYVPCTLRSDASCVLCSPSSLADQYLEYVGAGSCATRCVSGYYLDSVDTGLCRPCTDYCNARLGEIPSSFCVGPNERNVAPTCEPCPNIRSVLERWSPQAFCVPICIYGYVRSKNSNWTTCEICSPALCGKGFEGSCTSATLPNTLMEVTELQCVACEEEAPHTMYLQPGNCMTGCVDGFQMSGGICAPNDVYENSNIDNQDNNNNNNLQEEQEIITYPTRSGKHSSFQPAAM